MPGVIGAVRPRISSIASLRRHCAAATARSCSASWVRHTANAGQIYFPCGTPDPIDVKDGRVDLEHNARQELKDETGLEFEDLDAAPGWISVRLHTWAMVAKVLNAREPAEALRRRILGHLASQPQPELADIRIVRGPADLDPLMPPFVSAVPPPYVALGELLQERPAIR